MVKFKHLTKKYNQYKTPKINKTHKTHKGGCDAPFIPDPDGVWERTNGIKSGTFYNLLQFYKFIDWTTCNQMYKLGKDSKLSSNKVTSLQAITEAKLNFTFSGYVIYDTTNQIENQSHSFIFGNATVDTINKKVIFKQAPKDRIGNKVLTYTFNYTDEINLIIEKEKKEVFIFSSKDAKFTLGLKTGLEMPTTRINKMKDAMRQNRKTIEETEDQLTQTQKKDRQIFANRSKKGISNSMNTGGARTKTRKHKSQRGGNDEIIEIKTIQNSGQPREIGSRMSNQCMWVSISDYFKYADNEIKTVLDIKKTSGLTGDHISDTCHIQFDQSNAQLNQSMLKLCTKYNINLNIFIRFNYSSTYKITYVEDNGVKKLIPDFSYNSSSPKKINILNTPGHFELITEIKLLDKQGNFSNLYKLEQKNKDDYILKTHEIPTIKADTDASIRQQMSLFQIKDTITEFKTQLSELCKANPKNRKKIKDINTELIFAQNQEKRYLWMIENAEKHHILAYIIARFGRIDNIYNLDDFTIEQVTELNKSTDINAFKELANNFLKVNIFEKFNPNTVIKQYINKLPIEQLNELLKKNEEEFKESLPDYMQNTKS